MCEVQGGKMKDFGNLADLKASIRRLGGVHLHREYGKPTWKTVGVSQRGPGRKWLHCGTDQCYFVPAESKEAS